MLRDKLNSATIKINNLESILEESNYQKNKYSETYKQDMEEIMNLRFQMEEAMRKNRTLQLLLDSIDEEYRVKEEEKSKEHEAIINNLNQQMNGYRMETEDVSVHA